MSGMLSEIKSALAGLSLGPIQYFDTVNSTNDIAADWVLRGAPDLSLVIADEQVAGRGRQGRRWHTPPGAALAVSLILRPAPPGDVIPLGRYAALGALAVHQALAEGYGLPASIKWPNDVLLGREKVCGVLAEAGWVGDQPEGLVLGIGVNVAPGAIPPPNELRFPATSVESFLGYALNRWELLAKILAGVLVWRARLPAPDFVQEWEARLAFRGEVVRLGEVEGTLAGLSPEGHLRLETATGVQAFPVGDLSLRPVDSARK